MIKHITFTNNDADLVKKIEAFQKAQNLPSFVEAVRKLCQNGLHMTEVVRNLK